MKIPLQVLIAEDNLADAELVLRELRRAGFEPAWERVDSEEDFRARLHPGLDIVLSDYSMPQFGGLRALELLHEGGLDVPFILISGTIGEDLAVAAIKMGAADYLLKDRLARLGPAVKHAIEQGRLRRERQQAVDELRLFRTLVDHSEDTFIVIDPKSGRVLDVSQKGCAELGYTRAELLTLRAWDIYPPIPEAAWPLVAENLRTTGHLIREGYQRRRDGTTFPVELNARWVRLDRDFIVAVVRDITMRRQTEEQVREQAAMLARAHDAILVHGFRDRKIVFWNQGAVNLYGWADAEAVGREAGELLCVEVRCLDEIQEALLTRDEWRGEARHQTKGGKELIVNSRATLVRDASGAPKSVLLINTDVTEQKALEARYLRAQRMESIGTLASGVAHDLNNILAPIMLTVPVLRSNLKEEQRDELLSTIEASAKRGTQIIKQVLTFGRGLEGEKRLLQLDVLIKEMKKIMRGTFPKDILVLSAIEADLWPVLGDTTQLHQVLLNLCINARDAMPDGGTLRMRAANLTVEAGAARLLPEIVPGTYVLLEVIDTGCGMPPEVVERIFDPFFTTKSVGHGTGLGLSTTLGIVKSHGGFIRVLTEAGKGSTMQIYLPASPEHDPAKADAADAPPPHGHGELLLLVDDEPSVTAATRALLESSGYRILVAGDGTEALAVFATNSDSIAAVIADLMMPVMDGVSLTRALRMLQPALPIVASSGLGARRIEELELSNVDAILHKPYGPDVLLRTIHEALASSNRHRLSAKM